MPLMDMKEEGLVGHWLFVPKGTCHLCVHITEKAAEPGKPRHTGCRARRPFSFYKRQRGNWRR